MTSSKLVFTVFRASKLALTVLRLSELAFTVWTLKDFTILQPKDYTGRALTSINAAFTVLEKRRVVVYI